MGPGTRPRRLTRPEVRQPSWRRSGICGYARRLASVRTRGVFRAQAPHRARQILEVRALDGLADRESP